MSTATIYMDQCAPDGRTIRYNLNESCRAVAARVDAALDENRLMEVPNERGGEPIFINPERVASIQPGKER